MRWPWWLALIAVAVTCVVATVPAHLAVRSLPVEQWEIRADVGGTLWRGLATDVQFAGLPPATLYWRVRWLPLMTGRMVVAARWVAPWANTNLILERGLDGNNRLAMKALRVDLRQIPWQQLLGPFSADGTLQAPGGFEFIADRSGPGSARGELVWDQARITTPLRATLGRVTARARETASPGTVVWQLAGQGGDLAVDGELSLESGWAYRLSMVVTPAAGTPRDLQETLAWLLVEVPGPQGQTGYRIDVDGKLRDPAGG